MWQWHNDRIKVLMSSLRWVQNSMKTVLSNSQSDESLLWFIGVENLGQQRDIWLALLLYEAGLRHVLLGNGVILLFFLHLDFVLRLTLSEVPRPLVHLREINKGKPQSDSNCVQATGGFRWVSRPVTLPFQGRNHALILHLAVCMEAAEVTVLFHLWSASTGSNRAATEEKCLPSRLPSRLFVTFLSKKTTPIPGNRAWRLLFETSENFPPENSLHTREWESQTTSCLLMAIM